LLFGPRFVLAMSSRMEVRIQYQMCCSKQCRKHMYRGRTCGHATCITCGRQVGVIGYSRFIIQRSESCSRPDRLCQHTAANDKDQFQTSESASSCTSGNDSTYDNSYNIVDQGSPCVDTAHTPTWTDWSVTRIGRAERLTHA